ncbi:MAG: hypothetical protein ACOXZ4_03950 [Sphaerochaetaceae bacterium]
MKKVILVLALVLIVALPLTAASYMKTNGLGVGLSGGYPVSGVAIKYGMDDFRVVGTMGYNYGGSIAIEAGAQYDVYEFAIGDLPFYVNAGVTAAAHIATDFKAFAASVNVPVGLSYFFEQFPAEAFFKIAPGLAVYPDIKFDFGTSLGFLWYFD